LYGDTLSEPTIFTSWARIMLTMSKVEVAILLQRINLNGEDRNSKQGQMKWKSIAQHCITYLSNFLQLLRIPSFAPYMWFCSTYFAPPQCVILILTYLKQDRDPEIADLAFYFVDEMINFFAPEDYTSQPSGQNQDEAESVAGSSQKPDKTWEMLRTFRKSLDSSLESSGPNQLNQSTAASYRLPPSSASSRGPAPPPPKEVSNNGIDFGSSATINDLYLYFPGAAHPRFSTITADGVVSQKQHHPGSHAGDSDIETLHSASSTSGAWSSLTTWDVDHNFSLRSDLGSWNQIHNTSRRATPSSPSKCANISDGHFGLFS